MTVAQLKAWRLRLEAVSASLAYVEDDLGGRALGRVESAKKEVDALARDLDRAEVDALVAEVRTGGVA